MKDEDEEDDLSKDENIDEDSYMSEESPFFHPLFFISRITNSIHITN